MADEIVGDKRVEYKRSFRDLIVEGFKTYWPSILIPLVIFIFLNIIYYYMTERNIDKLEYRTNQKIIEVKQELESRIIKENYDLRLEIEKIKLIKKEGK